MLWPLGPSTLCCGAPASHCGAGTLGLGLSSCGSPALEHRLNICDTEGSAACGIFPDQGWNPCVLHWHVDSNSTTEPLRQPQKCMPGEIAKTQLEGPVLLGTAKTPARGHVKMKAKANNNKKSLSTNKQNLTVSTTNLTVMTDHLKSRKFTQPKPRRRQETGEESLELKSVLLWRLLITLEIATVKLNYSFSSLVGF